MPQATPTRRYQTVLFIDLDYTVMLGPFKSVVFQAATADLAQKSGLSVDALLERIRTESRSRRDNSRYSATDVMDWTDIARTVANDLGVSLDVDVEALVTEHARPPWSHILDDADNVLAQLKTEQRLLVAATKGLRKYQQPVLDGLGLTALFDHILTPDTFNIIKGERGFYGDFPDMAELCVCVGDKYEDDVVPAKRFGWKAVWRPRRPDAALDGIDPFARVGAYDFQAIAVRDVGAEDDLGVDNGEDTKDAAAERDVGLRSANPTYDSGGPATPDAVIHSFTELPDAVRRLEVAAGISE